MKYKWPPHRIMGNLFVPGGSYIFLPFPAICVLNLFLSACVCLSSLSALCLCISVRLSCPVVRIDGSAVHRRIDHGPKSIRAGVASYAHTSVTENARQENGQLKAGAAGEVKGKAVPEAGMRASQRPGATSLRIPS